MGFEELLSRTTVLLGKEYPLGNGSARPHRNEAAIGQMVSSSLPLMKQRRYVVLQVITVPSSTTESPGHSVSPK